MRADWVIFLRESSKKRFCQELDLQNQGSEDGKRI